VHFDGDVVVRVLDGGEGVGVARADPGPGTSPGGTLSKNELGSGTSGTDGEDGGLLKVAATKFSWNQRLRQGDDIQDVRGGNAIRLVHQVKDDVALALELRGEIVPEPGVLRNTGDDASLNNS
jgi:hypothetical protein